MRTLRGSLLAAAVAVVVATLYVFISFCSVLYVGANDTGEVADAIVVMGAAQYDGRPSPQLAARLDHALLLFNDGRAPLIAVTGGKQPGDRFTEAEASRRYLRARGVADSRIVAESQGGSTWESVRNLSPVLRSEGALFSSLLTGITCKGPSCRRGRWGSMRWEAQPEPAQLLDYGQSRMHWRSLLGWESAGCSDFSACGASPTDHVSAT